jgi:epoxyqueuosine reductase
MHYDGYDERSGIMVHALRRWAESRGYLVAWGPPTLVQWARADLDRRRDAGEIEPAFARDNLAFNSSPPPAATDTWRLLMVAMPRPAHLVAFVVGGRSVETILPPTYVRYRPTFEEVRLDLIANVLSASTVEQMDAPLKTLASRLGLIRYGRNNLAYAPHIGSYLQLLGYATDADLPVDPAWRPCEPSLLEECESCGVCEALCPTAAIAPERVLLHAERCLTLANELPGDWPAWAPASAHHCLVGCLMCQRSCPANPELRVENTGVRFDEKESAMLLGGGDRLGPVWNGIRAKLEPLGLSYQEAVIGRNLRAFLASGLRRRAPGCRRVSRDRGAERGGTTGAV